MRNIQETLRQTAAFEKTVLPSGLTVLVRPMPGYGSVHAEYATRFGSIDREFTVDGRTVKLPAGVAHFLEHKMFESEDGDAFSKYAKTGANANAFTSFDQTCYIFTATRNVDESMDVLLGMVSAPYFTAETIQKEQGIIGQEIRMYDDNVDWRMLFALCDCLYEHHPIRSDIAGTVESIAEITPEMLYACTDAFYSPSNMVLSAAGDVTMEQVLAACARAGLDKPCAKPVVQRVQRPEELTPFKPGCQFTMSIVKPCIGVGFKEKPLTPENRVKGEILCDLLSEVICGGMTPLYRKLYDEGLVNPGFGGEYLAVDGCCCLLFTGESEQPELVRSLLLEEIARVRREGVDEELFTLCKNQMYGEMLETLESVTGASGCLVTSHMRGTTISDSIGTLAALTKQELDEALQTMLLEEHSATVLILPAEGGAAEDEDEPEQDEE